MEKLEHQDKKKRSRQFSHDETTRLLCLIEDEPMITSKKTDIATNSTKDLAWKKVCTKFNSVGTYARDVNALRLKWDNLKKAAKKRSTAITINNRATGGGPTTIVADAVLDKVISLTSISCFGLPNNFDDDANKEQTNENTAVVEGGKCLKQELAPGLKTAVVDEGQTSTRNCDTSTTEQPEEISRWKNWTPTDLKTPMSKKLKSASNNRKANKENLDKSKIERNNAIANYYKTKLELLKKKNSCPSDSD